MYVCVCERETDSGTEKGDAKVYLGFPGGSDGKESACNAGDLGSIPGLGRSPGEGKGNPFQYSCWKIPWAEGPGRLQSLGSQSQTLLSD